MSKPHYKIRWFEYFILSILSMSLSLAILFNWFSSMIGDRTYSQMGSSRTSGLAYLVSNIEKSNWKYLLVFVFSFCTYFFFQLGLKEYRKKKNNDPEY